MAGMSLKGQYNLVSIMVPPRGVYERKVFTKEQKKTMFIGEKLTVMLHFRFFDRNFCEAVRNLIICIRDIFSILKIVKEFILDLMLEAVDIIRRF